MLTLHFANRFETLADDLVARLAAEARERPPLVPDEVIVPSAAITRRLIVEIAQARGVCANTRFSYLASWLWQQGRRLLPALEEESPFDADVLAWRIFSVFADTEWVAAQPRLADYLEHADLVMRHELAVRVAALFDQYLTYRPDWLEAWLAGEPAIPGPLAADTADDQRWQAALWRRLAAETGGTGRHPALALLEALDARGHGLAGTGALPRSAHVFCLPAMPPVHLQLLQRLGSHVDLHLYALNPSREFWFEVVEPRRLAYLAARGAHEYHELGNHLLAAWGRQAQSQLGLLVDAAGEALVDDARFVASGRSSLLGQVQDAILDLAELAPGSLELADGDRSIEVHVCHSLTRELEVLHDRLLGLFAGADPPRPGDVLVVTPDLDAAAPLIDAVFGTAPPERRLPYAITGRARAQVNAPARALLDLIALVESRFAVSDVFGLLQQPAVARRFELAEDDLDRIRDWLVHAGIHWALDADHRASFDLPREPRHSFADGVDRLFLGYALPAQLQQPFDGRLPAGNAEGSAALTLGAFWRFVDALRTLRARVAQPLSPADWPTVLAGCVADFVAPDDAELEDLRDLDAVLEQLATHWARAALALPLPLEVVRAALQRALDDPARGGVPTGMVTFASMSALRNVPFRVVCAIGLADGAFPTASRPAEFDLMARAPRAGDRQRRTDERNVFLDILLAARETLHLSHAGRSVRDNAVVPPSVLVSELLEVLLPATGARRGRLVVEHPLQPFAEVAFLVDADPRVRSFQAEYAQALKACLAAPPPAAAPEGSDGDDDDDVPAAATPFLAAPLAPPESDWHEVPLERLVAFFRNPCRFLVEKRLGIELRRPEDELQDDEPFVPEVFASAPLVEVLLPALLEGLSLEDARALALAGTALPAGGFGRRFLERELNTLGEFVAQVREHSAQPALAPHAIEIPLAIDGATWHLRAAFADLRPRGLLRHRYAKLGPLDYLGAWLPHLMLCAAGPAGVPPITTGIGRDGRFFLDECDEPLQVLESLVRLYAHGLREPLAFFPKASWAFVDGEGSLAKAGAMFRPGRMPGWSESEDEGVRLALRGRPDPLAEPALEFARLAGLVFDPLRACLETER